MIAVVVVAVYHLLCLLFFKKVINKTYFAIQCNIYVVKTITTSKQIRNQTIKHTKKKKRKKTKTFRTIITLGQNKFYR